VSWCTRPTQPASTSSASRTIPTRGRFLDTWSLIGVLLAETKHISFFTDVANLPLRLPAVMAKAAASLDVLSGGPFRARPGRRRVS